MIQLAQTSPSVTTFVTLAEGVLEGPALEITHIVVVNTSAAPAAFSICHDIDGAGAPSFGKDTALYWDAPIGASETQVLLQPPYPNGGITLGKQGALGFATSVADALTVTVYANTKAAQERAVAGNE